MAEEGSPLLSQPNCAICQQHITSKCFVGTCYHEFCYECLVTWSKVKPECPLCKRLFTSIIHNVTEMDKYDVHEVEDTMLLISSQDSTDSVSTLRNIMADAGSQGSSTSSVLSASMIDLMDEIESTDRQDNRLIGRFRIVTSATGARISVFEILNGSASLVASQSLPNQLDELNFSWPSFELNNESFDNENDGDIDTNSDEEGRSPILNTSNSAENIEVENANVRIHSADASIADEDENTIEYVDTSHDDFGIDADENIYQSARSALFDHRIANYGDTSSADEDNAMHALDTSSEIEDESTMNDMSTSHDDIGIDANENINQNASSASIEEEDYQNASSGDTSNDEGMDEDMHALDTSSEIEDESTMKDVNTSRDDFGIDADENGYESLLSSILSAGIDYLNANYGDTDGDIRIHAPDTSSEIEDDNTSHNDASHDNIAIDADENLYQNASSDSIEEEDHQNASYGDTSSAEEMDEDMHALDTSSEIEDESTMIDVNTSRDDFGIDANENLYQNASTASIEEEDYLDTSSEIEDENSSDDANISYENTYQNASSSNIEDEDDQNVSYVSIITIEDD